MEANISPSSQNQFLLFQRLRWRLFSNTLGVLIRKSVWRFLTILFCCLLIWTTLYIVSYFGFQELRSHPWNFTLKEGWIAFIFNLSFVALFCLLVFSTGIILYSSLFASQESNFLLVCPVTSDQIFAYKFQGALAFSSWAFVLLGSPILISYGVLVEGGAPWFYYLLLPFYFFGFILLPGSLGAFICLAIVNYFPRHRKQYLMAFLLALVAVIIWWVYSRLLPPARKMFVSVDALSQILSEFSLLRSHFLPSFWMAEGFRSAASGEILSSLYYLCLTWSNGLMVYILTVWSAAKLYRRGFDLAASGGAQRRRFGPIWLDHLFSNALCFLDKRTRLLISKDFRTFRRDPAQWAQIVIFIGLAVVYFLYIRSFYRQELGKPFQNGISLLNLTATGFLMCAYTGRFIYPMLSLEGRKFWILGLLPLERSRLLLGKFAFSAVGTLITGLFLVIFSNIMLNMPTEIILIHALTMVVLALGLSGLSVGMGATMPNFRETDPSKIAVGIGGTLTLILSLFFQIVIIVLMPLPWHLVIAGEVGSESIIISRNHWWPWMGILTGIIVGVIAVVMPLRRGTLALKKMEF